MNNIPLKQKRVLWLTVVPSPYRLCIFEEFSKHVVLDIIFIEEVSTYRQWSIPEKPPYNILKNQTWGSRLSWRFKVLNVKRQELAKYDTIVIGGWDAFCYLQLLINLGKSPKTVLFYESTLSSGKYTTGPIAWLRKWSLSRAGRVVVPGIDSARAVDKYTGNRITPMTSFNPIDVNFFDPGKFQRSPNSTEGKRFLYVGRFISLKNVDQLIRAFSRICSPDDTLTIAGYGPLERELKSIAASTGKSEQITFVGRQHYEDLPLLYSNHDIHVLPSKEKEVWGMVAVEALAMGLKTIVSSETGVLNSIAEFSGVIGFNPRVEGDLDLALYRAKTENNWEEINTKLVREIASPKSFLVDAGLISVPDEEFRQL